MKINYLAAAIFTVAMFTGLTAAAQTSTKPDNLMLNRNKIDSLDKRLIEILGERERVVKTIGIYKAKNNIPPLQTARFQEVLAKGIQAGEKEGLSAGFIIELLNAIHKESLRIEEQVKPK